MADSVALLRRKIEDKSLAVQDGTMNSVITLAAIEVRLPLKLSRVSFVFPQPIADIPWLPVWQRQYQSQRDAR